MVTVLLGRSTAAVALLVGLLALAACGPSEPKRDPTGDVVTYSCPSGPDFKVYFFAGNPTIKLEIGGSTSELTQVDSDLGILFANGVMELLILRDYANLTGSPQGDLLECEDSDQTLFG